MLIKNDYSLKKNNTFQINAKAKYFIEIENEKDILKIVNNAEFKNIPKFILGNGSNTLFTKNFDGIIIKPAILGKRIINETKNNILLEIGSGENWHKIVNFSVNNNWGGIENLALIPGTVGAAPVQNISAYGQNFSDVFDSLNAINLETGKLKKFSFAECEFGYRNSIFKKRLKNKYLITKIRLWLSKNPQIKSSYYQIGISHNSLKDELEKIAAKPYTIKDIYNAIIKIRAKKLPDEKIIPNAGSFFLNPIISKAKYEKLKKKVPELQCYSASNGVKVAAGRLLERAGWLGKWIGNCGIYDKHALIIVTNGKASGMEILNFAEKIKKSFLENYKIKLETEVNVV